ncbi:anaerobic C4-dicarboxylate transporter [Flagellimonas allohymeniacidonis]|uniref:C4-dicarboxylate transporter DcuA n=1 Tax=Flagellimonas allohymeniacidonis TaxID=2517819 RepID=A0A4Q8QDW6_9FLAO|nr:anaerobic C4-dicarboxylate transporter [Allomuricauda hymeniacidonis]TAI47318.1 anaerobic C4-dicarboxylate transporter [Allomuricauda hymeniacidonis]
MIWLELLIVLLFIFLGSKMGGIGIGYAGGAGVVVLTLLFGLEAGSVPVDVILIIMAVIAAIAAMQKAGGLDYLVHLSESVLRKNPKRVTFLGPTVTYFMTLLAGTGHTAYAALPVIVEVSKEGNVRPSKPLSISVVASQIAITASPISAAVVIFASFLEPFGISYLQLLAVAIPTTILACVVGAIVANRLGKPLSEDPVYQERLKAGLVKQKNAATNENTKEAKRSVLVFLVAIVIIVTYASLISKKVGLIESPPLARNQAIIAVMLLTATVIALVCKLKMSDIPNMSTFKSGMSAAICVLGVAWLGDTFVSNHIGEIKAAAGGMLNQYSWLLAVVLFFASMLLYSQAATTTALMPAALALGISPVAAIASFAAVSALFVLPTYPTLLAAVEMDDTGTTKIGKYVFNHSFIIPGIVTIAASVIFGFLIGGLIL